MMGKGFAGGFKSFKPLNVSTNATDCEAGIDSYRTTFYDTLATKLRDDEEVAPIVDCLLTHLKKFNFAEISMKQYVYEHTVRLSRRKRKRMFKAIEFALDKKLETASALCLSDQEFGDFFDEIYTSANETDSDEENAEEDYCLRKYLVDKNFTEITNINPTNIDTANIDCDEIVKAAMDETEETLSEEFVIKLDRPSRRTTKCINKAIRSYNYFGYSVRVAYFGEIGLSDEVKAEERTKFIEQMKVMYESIINCS